MVLDSLHFHRHLSRNTLIRMLFLALALVGLLAWKYDFLIEVYFRNQLTATGWIINGAILALFALGQLRIVTSLLGYGREERAIEQFMANLKRQITPLNGVPAGSLIAHRYRTMEILHKSNTPINHSALSSTLVAAESTRNSLPKFINNILILSGVFGTIVSLSIALIGASDLLASAINVDGMGQVVHGMSTALSTTITAIVCYLFFGYFYLKLTDVQTNLVSAVEQVTATHLMPRFQVQTDSVLYEFTGLIRSLQSLVSQMETSQNTFSEVEASILQSLNDYQQRLQGMDRDLGDLKQLLRQGFRLPEADLQ